MGRSGLTLEMPFQMMTTPIGLNSTPSKIHQLSLRLYQGNRVKALTNRVRLRIPYWPITLMISIMTLGITTFTITTHGIKGLLVTLSINDTQHNNNLY
jgi:hypothetical protein